MKYSSSFVTYFFIMYGGILWVHSVASLLGRDYLNVLLLLVRRYIFVFGGNLSLELQPFVAQGFVRVVLCRLLSLRSTETKIVSVWLPCVSV